MSSRIEFLKDVKKIVVKVGTKSLTDENNKLSEKKIKKLVDEISDLYKGGYKIILVSSGAVSGGVGVLSLNERPKSVPEKQAVASIGQIKLISIYHKFFSKNNINIGQILLTESDLKDRKKYLNAKNTLDTLLDKFNVIPIINENDVVGIEELIFGDNDELSALISNLIDSDLLILLTDIDGFYLKGELLSDIKSINNEITKAAGKAGSDFSKGGMVSKIKAAKIATRAGIPVIIAKSSINNILFKLLKGDDIGTFFYPDKKGLSQRKRWIAYSVYPKGKVFIDNGAVEAIVKNGKSLLPGGVVSIEGKFRKGDSVDICTIEGDVIGRGIINFNNEILNVIKGKKSKEIREILKDDFYEEVIHRDNLVLI